MCNKKIPPEHEYLLIIAGYEGQVLMCPGRFVMVLSPSRTPHSVGSVIVLL